MNTETITPVSPTEYDISSALGICIPEHYSETLDQFRTLLADPDNGIPPSIREQLCHIYTETGEGLSSFIPSPTESYSLEQIETCFASLLHHVFRVDDVDGVKKLGGITDKVLREMQLQASQKTRQNGGLQEQVSDAFFNNLTESFYTLLTEKIRQGALPMLEQNKHNNSFDLS